MILRLIAIENGGIQVYCSRVQAKDIDDRNRSRTETGWFMMCQHLCRVSTRLRSLGLGGNGLAY